MFLVGDSTFGFGHTVELGIEKAYECDLLSTAELMRLRETCLDASVTGDFDALHDIADRLEFVSGGMLEWNDGDLFWME